jgi:hypothetical protein
MVGMLDQALDQLEELQTDSPLNLDHPMGLIHDVMKALKMRGDTQ